ncbi:MAG: class I SAM-dependent methyltransferase [archaeon]|nr:class I SAM-dependent methyltransferase [archaeon]
MQKLVLEQKSREKFNPNNINERILDPKLINPIVLEEHKARYNFASEFVKGKKMLDCGCAGGYGTNFLSNFAQNIKAIDLSKEAVAFAKKNFQTKNIEFQQMDATSLKFKDSDFDSVISFEVIEHIKNQNKYLSEIKRVLKKEGVYVCSTPNTKIFGSDNNSFHEKEFSFEELKALLEKHFSSVEIFGQKHKENIFEKVLRKLGLYKQSSAVSNKSAGNNSLYFVAVCRK